MFVPNKLVVNPLSLGQNQKFESRFKKNYSENDIYCTKADLHVQKMA